MNEGSIEGSIEGICSLEKNNNITYLIWLVKKWFFKIYVCVLDLINVCILGVCLKVSVFYKFKVI